MVVSFDIPAEEVSKTAGSATTAATASNAGPPGAADADGRGRRIAGDSVAGGGEEEASSAATYYYGKKIRTRISITATLSAESEEAPEGGKGGQQEEEEQQTSSAGGATRIAEANAASTYDRPPRRLVAVRYFLDRPGYGPHNSASRLWFDPPRRMLPKHVSAFLVRQGIALDGLLVEVYLDKFQSFMLLDACDAACVEWDFDETTLQSPGILDLRLTDTEYDQQLQLEQVGLGASNPFSHPAPPIAAPGVPHHQHHPPELANTTPIAVFAFSFMNGLEAARQMVVLVPGTVSPVFALAWGPVRSRCCFSLPFSFQGPSQHAVTNEMLLSLVLPFATFCGALS